MELSLAEEMRSLKLPRRGIDWLRSIAIVSPVKFMCSKTSHAAATAGLPAKVAHIKINIGLITHQSPSLGRASGR
jgi:hypothetical protein